MASHSLKGRKRFLADLDTAVVASQIAGHNQDGLSVKGL